MTYTYAYSGKPKIALALKPKKWTVLEFPKHTHYVPASEGLLDAMLYLNVTSEEGWIRVRVVREGTPPDESAYHDYPLRPGVTLLTHTWFESCEAGRALHWEVESSVPAILTTRYSKWALSTPKES